MKKPYKVGDKFYTVTLGELETITIVFVEQRYVADYNAILFVYHYENDKFPDAGSWSFYGNFAKHYSPSPLEAWKKYLEKLRVDLLTSQNRALDAKLEVAALELKVSKVEEIIQFYSQKTT